MNTPNWPLDRMTFAPGTSITTFSEQSRATFPTKSGRLSVILSEPEKRLQQSPEELLAEVVADAKKIGMNLEEGCKITGLLYGQKSFITLLLAMMIYARLRKRRSMDRHWPVLYETAFSNDDGGAVISGKAAAALLR